jgi:hypothetical protein
MVSKLLLIHSLCQSRQSWLSLMPSVPSAMLDPHGEKDLNQPWTGAVHLLVGLIVREKVP